MEKNIRLELVKAIWESGFRAGFSSGEDSATSFEWGTFSREPSTGDKAWDSHVQWLLDTDTDMKLDIMDLEGWENIP